MHTAMHMRMCRQHAHSHAHEAAHTAVHMKMFTSTCAQPHDHSRELAAASRCHIMLPQHDRSSELAAAARCHIMIHHKSRVGQIRRCKIHVENMGTEIRVYYRPPAPP
eukprot:scaffold243577_cov18-Tisochrysis_lutea.AAC.1